MRAKSLIAFFSGTVAFGVVPYFDPLLPDDWTNTMLPFVVGLGGAVVVGALVVLVAGRREDWWLAPASALAGAVVMNFIYQAGAPPSREGFELGLVVADALYVFLLSGPAALVGATPVVLAFDLADSRRRREVS